MPITPKTGSLFHAESHFETVRQSKDGRLIDISLTVSPIKDRHGNVAGASKIARDITEKKRAEALLEQQAQRLERFPE